MPVLRVQIAKVDLPEPVVIQLPNAESAETCGWWDDEASEWSSEGCTWVAGACECTHLTVFAALLLFFECSTLSITSEFPGIAALFGEEFRAVSFVPFLVACAVLVFFAVAYHLDKKHEYYAHLSSVFFVDTPKPEKMPLSKKALTLG